MASRLGTGFAIPPKFRTCIHTFNHEGGLAGPLAISKSVVPMNVKFFRVLETVLNVSEMKRLLV